MDDQTNQTRIHTKARLDLQLNIELEIKLDIVGFCIPIPLDPSFISGK